MYLVYSLLFIAFSFAILFGTFRLPGVRFEA